MLCYSVIPELIKCTADMHRLKSLKVVPQQFFVNAIWKTSDVRTTEDSDTAGIHIFDDISHMRIRKSGLLKLGCKLVHGGTKVSPH